jgi:3-hydroxyacyl-[acyl-carrier-protein] dehydratase
MRYVLLDRITELSPPKKATALKCVSLGEDYFVDHFPGIPVMPGALILESLAQLGGTLLEACLQQEGRDELRAMLTMVDRGRFRHPVRPGDRMELETRTLAFNLDAGQVQGEARVDGTLVCEAQLSFVFVEVTNSRLLQARREYHRILTTGSSE